MDILCFHRRLIHVYVRLSPKYSFHLFSPVLKRRPGGFPTCARPMRGVRDRALREHRRSSVSIPSSAPHISGSGRGCPLLRASNEHILIVRVLRARRAPGCSLFLSVDRLVTRGWNSVPLALLPQSLTRQTEYLRAGRATAVYSL